MFRRWMLLAVTLGGVGGAQAGEPFHYPEGHFEAAALRRVNGIPVLKVVGTPEQIGQQVARLTAPSSRRLLTYPRDLVTHFGFGAAWPSLVAAGTAMLPQFPADHRAELEAMIAGSGLPREYLIAGNTLFDIKKMVACSAILVEPSRSRAGVGLLARNLDFPTLGYLQHYTLVTVYHPAGKHAFASVGFPGMVGVLSGMNDAGLALTANEVYASSDGSLYFDPKGVPYALCLRRVLEECATIDEAVTLLRSLHRTTCLNVSMMQKDGTAAVLEISAKNVQVRRAETGLVACTNHHHLPGMALARQPNTYDTVDRYRELCQFFAKDQLELKDLTAALHAANLGHHTLQSMVFEPATLTLHLATGATPSSNLPFRTLPLADLLGTKRE